MTTALLRNLWFIVFLASCATSSRKSTVQNNSNAQTTNN